MSGTSTFDQNRQPFRRTKLVATIGPATSSVEAMRQLLEAGMDVARLNFSHGTPEQHAAYIRQLRQTAASMGRRLSILGDLPGPRIRTGPLKKSEVELQEGATFQLTTRLVEGDKEQVWVNLSTLPQDVHPGYIIFLADGAIKLEVLSVTETDVRCRVVVGGILGERKGVNVPGVTLSIPSVTERDWQLLAFGLEQSLDFFALSFVREARDIQQVKAFLAQQGADVPLIAKIEKHEALQNIDSLLAAADGAMVARGDLGVEIPLPQVPLAQKEIVKKCNRLGKPVIVATQMLESMIRAPSPTRAEVTDVANAIFDGADALMLSGETAIGRYPDEAVRIMSQIAVQTEAALPYERWLAEQDERLIPQTDDAIAFAACHIAHQLGAAAIVAFTSSGSTAQRVAKYRPKVPILAITTNPTTQQRLALSWGVLSHLVSRPSPVEEMFLLGARLAREMGLGHPGDLIVVTGGVPIGVAGTTNLLKVQRIE